MSDALPPRARRPRQDEKLAGENYVRSSGLPFVIVRPGGLSDAPASSLGGLVVSGEDTLFGRDTDPGRVISREEVGDVCAEAVLALDARGGELGRVVEVVQSTDVAAAPPSSWFA